MREFRELKPETKAKISNTMMGRKYDATRCAHISQGVKKYWDTIPHAPESEDDVEEHDAADDII